jgi:hypothetical protein
MLIVEREDGKDFVWQDQHQKLNIILGPML